MYSIPHHCQSLPLAASSRGLAVRPPRRWISGGFQHSFCRISAEFLASGVHLLSRWALAFGSRRLALLTQVQRFQRGRFTPLGGRGDSDIATCRRHHTTSIVGCSEFLKLNAQCNVYELL